MVANSRLVERIGTRRIAHTGLGLFTLVALVHLAAVRAGLGIGLSIVRVPAYSPYAVAEHTIMLMLAVAKILQERYGAGEIVKREKPVARPPSSPRSAGSCHQEDGSASPSTSPRWDPGSRGRFAAGPRACAS